jgi:hypothetical protein
MAWTQSSPSSSPSISANNKDPRGEYNPHSNYSSNVPNNTPAPNYSAGNGGGGGQAAAQLAHAAALNGAEAQRVAAEQSQRAAEAAEKARITELAANKVPFYSQVRSAEAAEAAKPVSAFSGALDSVRDYVMKGPLGAITNAVSDVFGNTGTTYYGSQAPAYMRMNDPDYQKYMADAPVWDQFTYSMTPEEKNSQLPHAFIDGNPTTDTQKAIAALTNGRAPGYTIYNADGSPNITATANATNSEQRANGNGVSAPLGNSTYGSGFNGIGGTGRFTRVGGGTPGNYFSAIPDGVFNSGGSPAIMNIQTSYGNGYNAADQWTASGNATRAAQAAATTGES